MDAYLRTAICALVFIMQSAVAESDDLTPLISDEEMKAQHHEAMALIEQQLEDQLPADLTRHYQLINDHLHDEGGWQEIVNTPEQTKNADNS